MKTLTLILILLGFILTVLVFVYVIYIIAAEVASAVQPTSDQWQTLGKFNGGLNIMADRTQLAPNQVYDALNLIWSDDQLQGREGFQRYVAPLTGNPVRFIDIFHKTSGQKYLIYSDGTKLWYRQDLTQPSVELNFGRCDSGTVDTYAGSKELHGNTIAGQKLRTILGTGEGLTATVNDTNYIVDRIILDTLLWITTAFGSTQSATTYNVDRALIQVNSGLQISDNYWMYSNVGKFYFNRPDSFVVVDSLTGLRFVESGGESRRCQGSWPSQYPALRFAGGTGYTNYGGKFLRFTTNPKSTGTPNNPIPTGYHFYTSYPIRMSGTPSGNINTMLLAFQTDSTSNQYFTIEDLDYDSTTKFTTKVDSVRIAVADSAGFTCNGQTALYLKIYCDTCFFEKDTTDFITGDWFFSPNYTWNVGGNNYTYLQTTNPFYCFPVIGGYRESDSILLVGISWIDGSSRDSWDIDSSNCSVMFFRMKKQAISDEGIKFAVFHSSRMFEVRDSEPDRIYWSEVFMPDSFYFGSVAIIDQSSPLMFAAEQSGELVVYSTTRRWSMFPNADGTMFGKQLLDGTRGLVAKGSFFKIDNLHYGLAADGYWVSDGSPPQLISNAVASYFTDSINVEEYEHVAAGYDAENDNIWISFPRVGSIENDITLVYNRGTQSWWRQSFNAASYAYNPDITVSDSVQFLVGDTDSSTVYFRHGTLDDGVRFSCSFQTPYIDFGAQEIAKRYKKLLLGYNAPETTFVRSIAYRDFSATPFDTVSFSATATWNQKLFNLADAQYRGNNLSFDFTITNGGQFKLPWLKVLVHPLGVEQ